MAFRVNWNDKTLQGLQSAVDSRAGNILKRRSHCKSNAATFKYGYTKQWFFSARIFLGLFLRFRGYLRFGCHPFFIRFIFIVDHTNVLPHSLHGFKPFLADRAEMADLRDLHFLPKEFLPHLGDKPLALSVCEPPFLQSEPHCNAERVKLAFVPL